MEEKGIDEQMIKMKAGKFVALIVSVIIGTNSMALAYQRISYNESQLEYDRERAQRYADRKMSEAKIYHEMEVLKEKLKYCEQR